MRFLADMGVSPRVVAWLNARGHDAWHLQDRGPHRLPDDEIFRLAAAERRVVLTFDLDFGEIVALSGSTTGVVVFRLQRRRTDTVIERLEAVLGELGETISEPAVVTVEDTRFRVRRFPIRSDLDE